MAAFDTRAAVAVEQGTSPVPINIYACSTPLTPAAICGELAGERMEIDLGLPAHIRGSGLDWPPCARVERGRGAARLPAPIAWALCDHLISDPWQWSVDYTRVASCRPVDALSAIVSGVADRVVQQRQERHVTLVVPNTFDAETQDAMLRGLNSRGIDAFLLWRPVAAALSWIHRYERTLPIDSVGCNEPIGLLWTIHLGLDAFELACVELHVREYGHQRVVLPARRLPVLRTLYGEGLAWAECLASSVTRTREVSGCSAWNLLWTTPWLERVLEIERGVTRPHSTSPTDGTLHDVAAQAFAPSEFFRQLFQNGAMGIGQHAEGAALTRLRSTWAPLAGPFTQPRFAAFHPKSQLGTWLAESQASAAPRLPVLGYIGTGCFAGVTAGPTHFAGAIARELVGEQIPSHAIVEGIECTVGELLAEGAVLCAGRRKRGIPPYLDTLPQLESLVVRAGEPTWEDLLGARNRYVNGGEPWKYVPPNLGLYVQREERDLKLSVWREGHDTVREAIVSFPTAVADDTAVGLTIQMIPGQGSARIEVTPTDTRVFGGKRAYLDWARAEDIKKTRQQVLDEEPRTNPPLEPRGASLLAWRGAYWTTSGGARRAVRAFLDLAPHLESRLASRLNELRDHLWRTDPTEKNKTPPNHFTAVSSDGLLHAAAPDAAVLYELFNALDEQLGGMQAGQDLEELIRTLGYCSANRPVLADLLCRAIRQNAIRDYHLVAIGNCLRDPADINNFMQLTARRTHTNALPERNEWLKCLARLLQYRESATKDFCSDDCRSVSEYCLKIIHGEIASGKAKHLYRNASLCIVYLLRRRKFDSAYLDPNESLARRIKHAFELAITAYRTGRLAVIGGIVDLPLLMQMMIDYVDRRGRGRLMGLAISE